MAHPGPSGTRSTPRRLRPWPVVAALVVAAVAVAGCAQQEGSRDARLDADYGPGFHPAQLDAAGLPVPVLLCQAAQASPTSPEGCNFDMTPTPGRQGNEVTIAVNPKDPRHIVGGAKDYFPSDAGDCVWDGIYVTHDGAATAYHDRSLDGSPWRLVKDPTTFNPQYTSQFWCTTDPVAYFSADGKAFYYLAMAYQADPVTGSKACNGVCEVPDEACALPVSPCGASPIEPSGSLNDWAFNRATQVICKSSDNGDTFDLCTAVLEGGSYPVMFNDKGWIAASNDGVVHVMWLASLGGGNLYLRSTDGGQSYGSAVQGVQTTGVPFVMSSGPEAVTSDAGQGSFVDVGPGRQVYAAWTSSSLNLRVSNDEGATFGPVKAVLSPHNANVPGISSRDRRGGFPAMATDRNADSPFANALYFVFQDSCQEPVWSDACPDSAASPQAKASGFGEARSNIYFTASFDGGQTFSTPVRLNDDALPNGTADPDNYQFFPAVSVSPGGVIDVTWMDTRGAATAPTPADGQTVGSQVPAGTDHLRLQQYYTYSLDGGKTWARNLLVRDAPDQGWDPVLSHHQNGKVFIGDYLDIDSSWQAAHPVWPDTRDGKEVKVYTATLQRPMFATGWDPAKKTAAESEIKAQTLG